MKRCLVVLLVAHVCLTVDLQAQIPRALSYQGVLTDTLGNPRPDGSYLFTFRLYQLGSGGTPIWMEQKTLQVRGGLFSTILGDQVPVHDTVRFDRPYWMSVQVAAGPELSPRTPLTSVGYSFNALHADSARVAGGIADNTVTTGKIATGAVTMSKLNQSGATTGQVIKWTGTGWAPAIDSVGTGSGVFLPLTGGTMTGPITSVGFGPAITMGKGSFGVGNINTGTQAFVAGANNLARGSYSTVGGGGGVVPFDSNSALGDYSTVSGGTRNMASGAVATISGGTSNIVSGSLATVGGGSSNTASNSLATIGGGSDNVASAFNATVGGGLDNTASGNGTTVAGGLYNLASGTAATVGGGRINAARGQYSVVSGGGGSNVSDSNVAVGDYSMIPGGRGNLASGDNSFAAGWRARAQHSGAFVWADFTNADFVSTGSNQFRIRASGGTQIYSNTALTAGVTLAAGASAWAAVSDSAMKRNTRSVDTRDIMEKLARLPIKQWSYKSQDPCIEHVGPMAQDFYALFGLGDDEKTISTIDPDGIALAAIQELYKQTMEHSVLIADYKTENGNLAQRVEQLEEIVQRLTAYFVTRSERGTMQTTSYENTADRQP